jgi:heavy metal sensor kinase
VIRRVPIRWRLALAFAAAMAVLLAATGLFLRVQLADELDRAVERSLRTRSDEVGALVARAGAGGVRGLDQGGPTEDRESFVQVVGEDGRVVGAAAASVLDPDALRSARAGVRWTTLSAAPGIDEPYRVLARPVATDDGSVLVVVGETLESRDEAVASLTRLLLVAGPIALVLASVLGYALAAAALRPVEAMRRDADAVSGARVGARLPVPEAADELRRLGQTLNAMLERIDGALQRERAFVADASHELRSPLSILRAEIELALSGDRSATELRDALVSAGEETDRLTRLAEDLLVLARAEDGRLALHAETLPALGLLEDVVRPFAARAAAQGRTIGVVADDGVTITGDRLRIEQALRNLVDNALRHGGGAVTVRAASRPDGVDLEVADQGPGFEAAFAGRAFDRFSRADAARGRGGAGLGLAIVRAVARAHGGDAVLDLAAGGPVVRMSLPRAPA